MRYALGCRHLDMLIMSVVFKTQLNVNLRTQRSTTPCLKMALGSRPQVLILDGVPRRWKIWKHMWGGVAGFACGGACHLMRHCHLAWPPTPRMQCNRWLPVLALARLLHPSSSPALYVWIFITWKCGCAMHTQVVPNTIPIKAHLACRKSCATM